MVLNKHKFIATLILFSNIPVTGDAAVGVVNELCILSPSLSLSLSDD
jgi:hypothetical protein